MHAKWSRLLRFVAVLSLVCCLPGLSAQSNKASVAAIAEQAGVVLEPGPHLKDTSLLLLPHGLSRPDGMTSPKYGSIYVQQLQEESDYWQTMIHATKALRDKEWKPNFSSKEAYQISLVQHRNNLRRMLGLIEIDPEKLTAQKVVLATGDVKIEDLTITLEENFRARALLFQPAGKISGVVIAIPDAQESREEFTGIAEGEMPAAWLKVLLNHGLAVCVPVMIERKADYPFGSTWKVNRRQLLYRLGFIVGRTMVGMEVQQVLALRDYLEKQFGLRDERVGLLGLRQGGMTALYSGAVSGKFGVVSVVDYFQESEGTWREPVDRMLYGQLKEFGDAELAALIAPGKLEVVYTAEGPTVKASVASEVERAKRFYQGLGEIRSFRVTEEANANAGLDQTARTIATTLGSGRRNPKTAIQLRLTGAEISKSRNEHFDELHAYLQKLDKDSDKVRTEHWNLLGTPANDRNPKAAELRKALGELVGVIPVSNGPLHPHTRLLIVTDKFTAYDVSLDVLPGVHAYGQLLIPRRRQAQLPVVILQHGLGGRPTDITGVGQDPEQIYHALGSHLADLGYVVFAPYVTVPIRQEVLVNPLVQKAAEVGMMRTSLEVAKLHRIIDFLQTLPFVDGEKIGYYGLSYGGYSAIWMPPLEPRIKLNVISGHFNDWRTKITDEESSESYLRYQDADFYNWNVLNRFTHVELIAAMYPRPVCVEFGEHDPTTTPAWHGRAWEQVETWATAWGLEGQTAKVMVSHYYGVHEIHGIRTIAFLNRWLRPDFPDGRDHAYNLLPATIQIQAFNGDKDLATGQGSEIPLVTHKLDSSSNTLIRGRFYVSQKYPTLTGLALELSRAGHPGDLIVRFGSSAGGKDLGEARISSDEIDPAFNLWYTATVRPVSLDPSKLYYFEVTASSGKAPNDSYTVYGPQPLGGEDEPGHFGLSYRVLGAGEPLAATQHYERFGFMRPMLASYTGGTPIEVVGADPREPDEIAVRAGWSIHLEDGSDEVMRTAADDLSQFFQNVLKMGVNSSAVNTTDQIELRVRPAVIGVHTSEGYRTTVSEHEIVIEATSSRGVMRGVYALEDAMRTRKGPYVERRIVTRNMRFGPRITTAVHTGKSLYEETSFPLAYTDGLLQRMSHSGFNGIWVWLNTEEATLDSSIYPELNDSEAAVRLARLADLTQHARRYGIDIYIYLATGYNHHISPSFFQKHPDARGYGWGPPLDTSNPQVRRYYTETVRTIFHRVPDLKGMVVIYDSEGFWYTGNSERSILARSKECPRCPIFSQQEIAAQLLTTLDRAMHEAGGPDKELIAWNYNVESQWILKLIPMLPRDVIIQGDFDKGMIAQKDGIQNRTEDYNISNLGPSQLFIDEYRVAREHGFQVMAKTEHAISQEFIFVPYIPCMGQWYGRIAKMREYDLKGWFGNWNHYGYTPSLPAVLINRMSFDPAPTEEGILRELAVRNFGSRAAPYVIRAWHDYSQGIREFPYSDPVARTPGPVQKGASQPLFMNPRVKGFGPWRSWQNDLNWTKPWGPEMTAKYLGRLEELYVKGNAELESAETVAPASYRPALEAEWRVGRTIQSSVETALHLIDWIQTRDAFYAARSASERQKYAAQLEAIAFSERDNAQAILPLLDADSRLGFAAVGDGGLFIPALVRWKVGEVDDVLLRQLPGELERMNAGGQ